MQPDKSRAALEKRQGLRAMSAGFDVRLGLAPLRSGDFAIEMGGDDNFNVMTFHIVFIRWPFFIRWGNFLNLFGCGSPMLSFIQLENKAAAFRSSPRALETPVI
jgi:hypothetical protein